MKIIGLPVVCVLAVLGAGVCGLIELSGGRILGVTGTRRAVIPMPHTESSSDSGNSVSIGSTSTDYRPVRATPNDFESNLRLKIELLERGIKTLEGISDYTTTLQKQEVVNEELLGEQTILLKCRCKPFSVYMQWLTGEAGREAIYVDGKNNGKMIVHDGGWKARIPAIKLDPDGTLAMIDTRYPVTSAGLMGLAGVMLGIHQSDLVKCNFASCEVDPHQSFDGRECYQFTTKYKSPALSPTYRKSVTYVDRELGLPVYSRHYEWPKAGSAIPENELDDATMIESYSFTDVKFECGLSDSDFDRSNPDYQFR